MQSHRHAYASWRPGNAASDLAAMSSEEDVGGTGKPEEKTKNREGRMKLNRGKPGVEVGI